MPYLTPNFITPYPLWNQFTPTLPNLYWDVDSHEERIKRICLELHKIVEYADYLGENINLDHETIDKLQHDFEMFMESGFDDYYKEQVIRWIDENFNEIMDGLLGHMLFFGLTKNGYFTCYIPPKWAIEFDTDVSYESPTYGCLEIIY